MELLNISTFLFSGVVVLIGSLAFHISALISGHNIYRDISKAESTWLSMVAGIVIFLLSPISSIIFSDSAADYADISVQILDFEVLLAFFGGAVGFGLIFGSLTIVKARVNVLEWFRDKSGMRFWIYSYGVAWDDLLLSVKRNGEVSIQIDETGKEFKGLLKHFSIRGEPKEMVLYNAKCIGLDGVEEDIGGEGGADLWIDGSKIKKIIVPERSFKKHFDSMGHISQAFYCIIASIGFFFLSYSAYLTGNYLEALGIFYHKLSLSFLVLTIFVLCVSVWVAKKDFDNWRSFLVLSPIIVFLALFFSLLSISLIIFDTERSQALIFIFFAVLCIPLYGLFGIKRSNSSFRELLQEFGLAMFFYTLLIVFGFILCTQLSPVVIFIFVSPPLYLIINGCLKEPIKKCFDGIENTFTNDEKLLKEVIQKFYLRLSCNDTEKAHMDDVKDEILAEYKKCGEKKKIIEMVNKLNELKKGNHYLKNEDFNIILAFRKHIKKS